MVKQAPIWDLLKAETLRSMCRDLGFPWLSNRDAMQTHLQIAFKDGNTDEALREAIKFKPTRSGSPKRKATVDDEEEESPARGKRARRSDAAGESASAPPVRRTRASAAADEAPRRSSRSKAKEEEEKPKPKKKQTAKRRGFKPGPKKAEAPASRASVFDGVVVPRRLPKEDDEILEQPAEVEAEADVQPQANGGEEDDEHSSLYGSSNKENDGPAKALEAEAAEADAEGSLAPSEPEASAV